MAFKTSLPASYFSKAIDPGFQASYIANLEQLKSQYPQATQAQWDEAIKGVKDNYDQGGFSWERAWGTTSYDIAQNVGSRVTDMLNAQNPNYSYADLKAAQRWQQDVNSPIDYESGVWPTEWTQADADKYAPMLSQWIAPPTMDYGRSGQANQAFVNNTLLPIDQPNEGFFGDGLGTWLTIMGAGFGLGGALAGAGAFGAAAGAEGFGAGLGAELGTAGAGMSAAQGFAALGISTAEQAAAMGLGEVWSASGLGAGLGGEAWGVNPQAGGSMDDFFGDFMDAFVDDPYQGLGYSQADIDALLNGTYSGAEQTAGQSAGQLGPGLSSLGDTQSLLQQLQKLGLKPQDALSAARQILGGGSTSGGGLDLAKLLLGSGGINGLGGANGLLGAGIASLPSLAAINYATNLPDPDISKLNSAYSSIDPNSLALPYDIQTGRGRETLNSSLTSRGVMGSSFGNQDIASYDTLRGLGRSSLLTSGASAQADIASKILAAQQAAQKNKLDLYGRSLLALSGGLNPARSGAF